MMHKNHQHDDDFEDDIVYEWNTCYGCGSYGILPDTGLCPKCQREAEEHYASAQRNLFLNLNVVGLTIWEVTVKDIDSETREFWAIEDTAIRHATDLMRADMRSEEELARFEEALQQSFSNACWTYKSITGRELALTPRTIR
jgi:hypothetical protein